MRIWRTHCIGISGSSGRSADNLFLIQILYQVQEIHYMPLKKHDFINILVMEYKKIFLLCIS